MTVSKKNTQYDQECRKLTDKFKDKFGMLPDIQFIDTNGYGFQFCLFKNSIFTAGVIPFYKMGVSFETASHYIDNLIMIPSAIITFNTLQERDAWRKAELLSRYQAEMNELFSNKEIYSENITGEI